MKMKNISSKIGAALFIAAVGFLTLTSTTDANSRGGFGTRNDGGMSINRGGADDPIGHDAGDDHGRGRGRGRGRGHDDAAPTPSPAATPDDRGGRRGPGGR